MIENIKLSEKQIKDSGCYFKKMPVVVSTDMRGDVNSNIILSSDSSGITFVFFGDDENAQDYYYQFMVEIDIFDRDRLLSHINNSYNNRLKFNLSV